ncbi:MAG: P1 family peptidase [Anaerolineae bacterium]
MTLPTHSPVPLADASPRPRARDLGITIGVLPTGPHNAITDVAGVRVGHTTLIQGEGLLVPGVGPIRTGVTAIIPHDGDIVHEKPTGAVVRINGFGEVTNSEQVHEMGVIEGPLMLTNTHNVPRVADAVIDWMFDLHPAMGVTTWGVSPIVAETHDGLLNDIRGRHVGKEHVYHAIDSAHDGPVEEGAVGGGTGMICYDFKGGIGTASRRLAPADGGYTVGVLVQANFGRRINLMIDGAPVGRALEHYGVEIKRPSGGSLIVVIATDAPMTHRQLTRLGLRATHGMARTGSLGGNTSGDFAIVFSTTRRRAVPSTTRTLMLEQVVEDSSLINRLFTATVEATEEAILNALFKATTMTGRDNLTVHALPIAETVEIMNRYGHHEVHLP